MSLLEAAYGYVESFPAMPIIPLGDDKRPTIRTGRDHAEGATLDTEVITDWHRRGLLKAIGTPTGAPSDTVVIDVDSKGDGWRLLAELERDDVLGPLPRDRVASTRSKGGHIYLRHPGAWVRVRSGASTSGQLGKLLGGRPGIDVRADGGLVVLPPSPGYSWIADGDGDPLPPLPPLWLAAINGAGDAPPPPSPTPIAVPDDQKVKRASAYLAKMPASISGAGGHGALWDAVTTLMYGFDLDVSTTRTLIASEYNHRCDPPWSAREIEHKLRQASERCTRPRGYLLGGRA